VTRRTWLLLAPAGATLAACGYHVAGHSDLLPKSVHTIAIPAFENGTTRYKLAERIPGAIGREFETRTRYRIVAKPEQADAVLKGTVVNYFSGPTIFDTTSGRAAGIQILVILRLSLVERATGKVLWERPSMEIRERYEVSIEQQAYFDESQLALDRLCGSLARQVVSTVISAF